MVEATKKLLVENYCNFKGRTSRRDFWLGYLGVFLLDIVVSFVLGFICGLLGLDNAGTVIGGLIGLALILPLLGAEIRRLHDINKSGWWIFISLVPFVGSIILLVFLCLPAVEEGNNF